MKRRLPSTRTTAQNKTKDKEVNKQGKTTQITCTVVARSFKRTVSALPYRFLFELVGCVAVWSLDLLAYPHSSS